MNRGFGKGYVLAEVGLLGYGIIVNFPTRSAEQIITQELCELSWRSK